MILLLFYRFIGCVGTTTAITEGNRTLTLQWLAYQNVAADNGYSSRETIPFFTTGSRCIKRSYQQVLSSVQTK